MKYASAFIPCKQQDLDHGSAVILKTPEGEEYACHNACSLYHPYHSHDGYHYDRNCLDPVELFYFFKEARLSKSPDPIVSGMFSAYQPDFFGEGVEYTNDHNGTTVVDPYAPCEYTDYIDFGETL